MGCVDPNRLSLIVRDMLRSGLFYPSTEWCKPSAGRGMVLRHAEVMWKIVGNFDCVTEEDVMAVFFNGEDRHMPAYTKAVLRKHRTVDARRSQIEELEDKLQRVLQRCSRFQRERFTVKTL